MQSKDFWLLSVSLAFAYDLINVSIVTVNINLDHALAASLFVVPAEHNVPIGHVPIIAINNEKVVSRIDVPFKIGIRFF